MHHGYRHRPEGRLRFHRPFPNRQELLERLERYQRDLEQEIADLEDIIQHLRGSTQTQAQPSEA